MKKEGEIKGLEFGERIDYLDLLKGFAILWIVWYHEPHPDFINYYYHVPIFFFISGIVFKYKPLKKTLSSILCRIVIPFVFFYIISYCFQILRFFFENATFIGFDWGCIMDVFRIDCMCDYILVNRPLWFLVSLSVVQIMYYFLYRFPKLIILFVCIIILLFKEFILSIHSPFMINQSVFWLLYFALGDIIGKQIVIRSYNHNQKGKKQGENKFKSQQLIAIAILIVTFSTLCFIKPYINNAFVSNIVYELSVLFFVIMSILVFSCFYGKTKVARLFRFYGQNSLVVLGLHWLVIILYGGFFFRIFGITGDNLIGFSIFVLTAITLYPVILFLNKKTPFLVGKKQHISKT